MRTFTLLVKSLQRNRKIQCGNSCGRMPTLFELFRAVFLFIWCGNGVPAPVFLALHAWVWCLRLVQLCPTYMAYWAKNYVITHHCLNQSRTLNNISRRDAHWMVYFNLSKANYIWLKLMSWKASNPNCSANRRDKVPQRTTCKKCQIPDYLNKDKLSVCSILLLQRKPKLGRTKPSTGLHAARGPRVGHSWISGS